jgi:hypothetical protein
MTIRFLFGLTGCLLTGAAASAQSGIPLLGTPPVTNTAPGGPNNAVQATNYVTPLYMYRMPDVSRSLNLTADQLTRLNQLSDRTHVKYRDQFGGVGTLAAADRDARVRELSQQYNTDWSTGAQGILNRDQWTRYQQLHHQYAGFDSLTNADIQRQLNLTPQQVRDLDAQRTWNAQQLNEISRLNATDPTRAAQLYRDYTKARQDRFNQFLTPEQQKAWNQLAGEPYTFAGPYVPPTATATTPPDRK